MKKELHILMLEDNPVDAELMEQELKDSGMVFLVKRVEKRDDFIAELDIFAPDIILTDYKLPAFNGISALEISKKKYPEVPVIFVTGALGEEMAVEIFKKGATDYILKHRLSHLAPAVKRTLREIQELEDRKKADKALKDSEQKYHALTELSPVGVFYADAEGDFIYTNESFIRITGLTQEEALGKGWINTIHPDDRDRTCREWYQAVRERQPFKSEFRFLNKNNKTSWVLAQSIIEPADGDVRFIGTITDITERKHAEEQLKNSLSEKDILLREIHHRVKNNMQVISSLLMLQEDFSDDEKFIELLKDSQNRIISMVLIHEKLYRSENLSKIDFKEYIEELAGGLFQSYGVSEDRIRLNIDSKNIFLGIDTAIPCGLIINELVSNSLKHAFPDRDQGEINIIIHSIEKNMTEIIIGDNGIGIPEDIDLKKNKSLGLLIVNVLVKNQLHGDITLNRGRGTEFKIRFRSMK